MIKTTKKYNLAVSAEEIDKILTNSVLVSEQELTTEEQAQARKNIGLNVFAYNFTKVCNPPVETDDFFSPYVYDTYTSVLDAQAIDRIVQNWQKEPMSIYIQGYPVIGVDLNNHHLKVLYNDRYIYTFSWHIDAQVREISLWAHAVSEILYSEEAKASIDRLSGSIKQYIDNQDKALENYVKTTFVKTSGGSMSGPIVTNGIMLTSETDYGPAVPTDPVEEGKLFFVEDNDCMDLTTEFVDAVTVTFARVVNVGKAATLQLQFTCSQELQSGTAVTHEITRSIPVSVEQIVHDVTNARMLTVNSNRIQTACSFPAGTYTFNFPLY